MLRNIHLLRLPNGISATPDQLAAQLETGAFKPCGPSDRMSAGWIEPRDGLGLVFAQEKQRLICFQVEEKILPSSYITRCAEAKAEEIAEAQGFKPGRKQMREIRENIEIDLLPRAFTRLSKSFVWIDNARGWMAIEGTAARCDDVVAHLRRCLEMIPHLVLPKTRLFPGTAMTQWLAAGEAPGLLSIDRDCELRAVTEEKAAVRYVKHNLDSDDVRGHIAAGKTATKVALTWNDRVSFTLTDGLELKKIALLDILKEDAERQAENGEELFAAEFAIYSGEIAQVIAEVIKACGGEEPDIGAEAA